MQIQLSATGLEMSGHYLANSSRCRPLGSMTFEPSGAWLHRQPASQLALEPAQKRARIRSTGVKLAISHFQS